MRNKKLKLSAVLLLGLGLTGLHAQTMYVNEKSGKQTAYPLNTVQKMTFSGGKVTVQKTDNSEGGFAFVDVKYINYTSAPADFTAPSVPANVAKTGQSTSTASFSWTASTDNVGVVYYLIFKDGVKIDSVTTTSYTATALSANTSYIFTVKAGDASKNVSAASTALSVTTSKSTGIEDLHLVSLVAYPSPVADILNVDLSGLGDGTLCILTLEGKLLLEQTAMGTGIVSINLSQLAQGMYQCRFVTATGFRSVQIVKQ